MNLTASCIRPSVTWELSCTLRRWTCHSSERKLLEKLLREQAKLTSRMNVMKLRISIDCCRKLRWVTLKKPNIYFNLTSSKFQENIEIDGVCCGCILSDYQRIRCENVCTRLNLKCFSYLYRRDQAELLQEMADSKLDAILIKVACLGLNCADHLGKSISEVQGHLMTLYDKFGCNVCGEGGEYETFTLDCPLFKKRIVMWVHLNDLLFVDNSISFINT